MAGSVKGRKAARHATSDWMALEKERGISVTSSVMQFPYEGRIVNLLDTPGHADFGEDTYRVLTAVDSALMVIDVAKGVEERTIKLMEVCRLRDTPIMTFINKLDREGKPPIDLLDEVESRARHPVRAGDLADRHGQAPEGRRAPDHRRSAPVRTGPQLHPPGFDDLRLARRSATGSAHRRATCWPNCATSSNWCRAPRIRSTRPRTSPASRRRCSSARRSTTSACSCCSTSSSNTRRRRKPRATTTREVAPVRAAPLRLRVQDPGEHGSAAPRPRRVHAHLLGQVRRRHEGVPRAHRQGSEARQRADLHGQRPRDRRDRLSGRRHRHPQPRHDLDRRHLQRRRDAVVHRHPQLRAGAVPPRAPARSAQAQAAAEGPGAAVRGRRDAVLPPADVATT